jgi:glycosyltransferase involved in cell wall biosynthesis
VVGRRGASRLALNGKWLTQETTGTQRYACELTRHLLPLLPDRPVLHVPSGAVVPDWLLPQVQLRRSRMRGTAFEQLALPWAARRDLLLSLGGAAPVLARRQVATMHDATMFRLPHTYSRTFATWYRFMYRTVARRAQRVLTVSEFSRRELIEILGLSADRVVVVPNGVEHAGGTGDPVEVGDAPFVLMIGPPAAHKNIAPVATALSERGIPVVLVGGAGASQIFRSGGRPADASGPSLVRRMGRLSDAQITWLYRQASALVFPSLYEGFGLPVVEAQRLGCPVVASDRASVPEVAGDAAVLVDPTRPGEMAEQVAQLLADPARMAWLAASGHRNADRFQWSASAARLARTLTELRGPTRASEPRRQSADQESAAASPAR